MRPVETVDEILHRCVGRYSEGIVSALLKVAADQVRLSTVAATPSFSPGIYDRHRLASGLTITSTSSSGLRARSGTSAPSFG